MLAQVNIHVSPNNRISFSRVPLMNFHNQGKQRNSYKTPDEQEFNDFLEETALHTDAGIGAQAPTSASVSSDGVSPLASHLNCKNELPEIPTRKKFTRHARQTILAAAGALEKDGHKATDFFFFTGTLPGSSPEACEMMARYSRYTVNSLKQYLRDYGIYCTFNTWEWQKRTSVGRGRNPLSPALHLHMCILSLDEKLNQKLPQLLRDKWLDILDSISAQSGQSLYERDPALGGVSFWTRESSTVIDNCCKTVRCEKSPAAYLSKYVGKDSLIGQGFADWCIKKGVPVYYPSSWWSISNELRLLIKKWSVSYSFRMPFDASQSFIDEIIDLLSPVCPIVLPAFSPEGFPDYSYRNIYVSPDVYVEVISMLNSLYADFEDSQTGFARLDSFRQLAINWLCLPRNYRLLDKFIHSMPISWQALSFDNPHIIDRAASWVMSLFIKQFNPA
jgi:hypothetical protein